MFELVGFWKFEIRFRHGYDLSNAFCELRDRKPTGVGTIRKINTLCDKAWKQNLEESGRTELLCVPAEI